MSKKRTANTVNRMEISQKNRNLSVPKTKMDSIIVLVKATQEGGARPEHLSQENHPENHKAEGAHRARRNGSASNPTESV